MKKINKKDLDSSTKIVIMPWEKGFTCGIVFSKDIEIGFEEDDMIAVMARGMIKSAVSDPHKIYLMGLQGFTEDKIKIANGEADDDIILSSASLTEDNSNVIDFFEYYIKPKNPKDVN